MIEIESVLSGAFFICGDYLLMPRYNFKNLDTDDVECHYIKIAELDEFKKNNPQLKQELSTPGFGDAMRLGITKTPESFNSLLKEIKKNTDKGLTKSTIKTR